MLTTVQLPPPPLPIQIFKMEAARPPSREEISDLLRSIERYNPGNLDLFCRYIKQTVRSFPIFSSSEPHPPVVLPLCTVLCEPLQPHGDTVNVTSGVLLGVGGLGAPAVGPTLAPGAEERIPPLTLALHSRNQHQKAPPRAPTQTVGTQSVCVCVGGGANDPTCDIVDECRPCREDAGSGVQTRTFALTHHAPSRNSSCPNERRG